MIAAMANKSMMQWKNVMVGSVYDSGHNETKKLSMLLFGLILLMKDDGVKTNYNMRT